MAVDVGTSHARAMLFDSQASEIERMVARHAYEIPSKGDGSVEIHADRILDAIYSSIDELLVRANELAPEIGGVACCTLAGNVLGLDKHGKALTPLMIYADTRPSADVHTLRSLVDEEDAYQRTGCRFHTSYLPARFLWMSRTQPQVLRDVRHWLSLGELLFLRLFGETAVSVSIASWGGLLNRNTLQWDEDLLSALPVAPDRLSPLCDFNEPFSGLRNGFKGRWPALAEVPWFPAVGDGAAANIGSGCASAKRVAVSLGTTSAVRVVLDTPLLQVPKGLWCYRVDRKRALLGGALSEGANLLNWLKRLINLEGIEKIDEALANLEPGKHGLTFLPLVSGERSPGWISEARGVIVGLSLATTPLDLLQAGLEGIICRIAQVYDLLSPYLPQQPEVVASGGVTGHVPFMLPALAGAIGTQVMSSLVSETSARGTALLGLEALGIIKDIAEAPLLISQAYQPKAEHHVRYRQMIQRQQALYDRVILDSRLARASAG
jgi:gluconokinase